MMGLGRDRSGSSLVCVSFASRIGATSHIIRVDIIDADKCILDENFAILKLGKRQVSLVLKHFSAASLVNTDTGYL
jgi:hypothetical protein